MRLTITLILVASSFISLTACSTPPTSKPATIPTQPATATTVPSATATANPTATTTATKTATPRPSYTPTVAPTPTPLPKPTKIPVTPTATTAPTTVSFPLPEVHPFDVGGFIDYLNRAHGSFQQFLSGFGNVVAHGIKGNCNWYNQTRNDWMGMIAFSDVPAQWQPLYSEYRSLIAGAFEVTQPIYNVCSAGGGAIDDTTDQQIINFFDAGQNRLYQLIRQANSLK